ncbi:cobalamin biosynthesis protein CobG [Litchfieldella xinjiangensis]|uniref:cobalamin biosynthesis protein CobG n=1 Tax=Litchfieldella xinjiangensis TaxID=1166948 RepID=UPI0005BA24A3|nr:cobalamin biosynthesis protein CobG [Halomonas xinjiangensis]
MMTKPTRPRIKGWCPGAWRPMATGDGMLVRVRPALGQLSRDQMLALCEAAETFGSGLIELTSRANLQLRGVTETTWPRLMASLIEHGLVEPSAELERGPQCLLAPEWRPGDATHETARMLLSRLDELPALPAKMGIAIDVGEAPVLQTTSADFRIERSASGSLLVRADGRALGTPVGSPAAAVDHLIRMAHWFIASGGGQAGRMRRHQAPLPSWAPASDSPAESGPRPALGDHARGRVVGLPFGRAPASVLRAAIETTTVTAVRVTPWRRLLLEGAERQATIVPGLLNDERDPRLATDVCPGAPYCEQASVETLGIAERLSGRVEGSLHVSGCAKSCASQRRADMCLVGRAGRFDLIIAGRTDATPVASGLSEADLLDYLERIDASRL